MFCCLVWLFGLFLIEIQGQQLELLHSEAAQNVTLVSIRQLAGRKTRIAQDLPNATLAIWGDAKEDYLFGEKYRDLLGPATFPSFDARVHYLNYGFFYAVSNEKTRFIPLPTGHHCQGQWFQYGKVRGVFLFYDGQYRFGGYCLNTGAVAFLDKHGHPIVFQSNSETGSAPHEHTGFYQICIGKNKKPVPQLPPISSNLINSPPVNSNCENGINCYSQNDPTPQKQNNSQVAQNSPIIYNCDEFSAVFDCENKKKQLNEPFPPTPRLIAYSSFVKSASQNQDLNSAISYGQIEKQFGLDSSLSYAQIPLSVSRDAYNLPPLSPRFDPHYKSQQSNAGKTSVNMIRFLVFFGISMIVLSILL